MIDHIDQLKYSLRAWRYCGGKNVAPPGIEKDVDLGTWTPSSADRW